MRKNTLIDKVVKAKLFDILKRLISVDKNEYKYDLFVSLGYGCPVSRILRKQNLQFSSFPFDWVCGTDILGRSKIVAADFASYCEKDCLEFYSQATSCNCYRNTKTDICFPHDFGLNMPLEKTYPEVYEKYRRRIKRLIDLIEKSDKVCFVYITKCDDTIRCDDYKVIKSQQLISQRFPKVKIDFLYFENAVVKDWNNHVNLNQNIKKYMFDYKSDNKDMPWEVDDDKILNVLRTYKISNKHLTLRNWLQKYKVFSVTHYQKHTKILFCGIKISRKKYA